MKIFSRDEVYAALKNKIESGYYPVGSKLPSKKKLCLEFGISDTPVRYALDLLEKDGLIEKTQGRAPIVKKLASDRKDELISLHRETVVDILSTREYFCTPLAVYGAALCREEDWRRLTAIIGPIASDESDLSIWKRYRHFWRYFINKIGNDLINRTVDLLGVTQIYPLPQPEAHKSLLKRYLENSLAQLKDGSFRPHPSGESERSQALLGNIRYSAASDVISADWPKGISERLSLDIRLSSVYLDILGKISVGAYPKGGKLPSHKELCLIYGVSHNTTIQAIGYLRGLGAVTSVRSKGIYINITPREADEIVLALDPKITRRHFREYLNTLEALELTVKSVSRYAAKNVTVSEAEELRLRMENHWHSGVDYLKTPVFLLDFIISHTFIKGLREIYEIYRLNFSYACSIPGLISHTRQRHNRQVYELSLEAVKSLCKDDKDLFSQQCETMFSYIRELICSECNALGYMDTFKINRR